MKTKKGKKQKREPIIWTGCYDSSHKGLISDASFCHPAKAARGLLVKIFDYLFENQYLKRGSIIVDPFGGIGTTAIESTNRGCRSFSVELEKKFVNLANGFQCPGPTAPESEQCDDCKSGKSKGGLLASGPHLFSGNFQIHEARWKSQKRQLPILVQGDSRNLCQILGKVI